MFCRERGGYPPFLEHFGKNKSIESQWRLEQDWDLSINWNGKIPGRAAKAGKLQMYIFLIHRRSGSLFIPWIISAHPLRHLPHLVIFQAALPALFFNPLNIPPDLTCPGLWGVSPRSRRPTVGLPFHRHSGGPACPNCRCFRNNFPKDVPWGSRWAVRQAVPQTWQMVSHSHGEGDLSPASLGVEGTLWWFLYKWFTCL